MAKIVITNVLVEIIKGVLICNSGIKFGAISEQHILVAFFSWLVLSRGQAI